MKRFLNLIALIILVNFALIVSIASTVGAAEPVKIKIGVTSGPHEEIMEIVKKIAIEKGLDIEVVTFSDYVLPNAALADKELDANSIQHLPYLQNAIDNKGYKLTPIANTVLMPMAVYSKSIKSEEELKNKDGITVAIPNDPSNGGRALLLLASYGFIELNPAAKLLPTVIDITKNEKNMKFIELDAAQLIRALDGTDVAVINTNYAIEVGMVPERDALLIESKDSPYVNIIVVRTGEENRPEFKTLLEVYQSNEVKKFIGEHFKGAIVAGW